MSLSQENLEKVESALDSIKELHSISGTNFLLTCAGKSLTNLCDVALGNPCIRECLNREGTWKGKPKNPFILACEAGNLEVCRKFLYAGASVHQNFDNETLETPLAIAARTGNVRLCQLLLGCNANILAVSSGEFTPLSLAVRGQHKQICEMLLYAGAPAEYSFRSKGINQLLESIAVGNFDIFKLLLIFGANPNFISPDKTVPPPLLFSIKKGYTEFCKTLIEFGADINGRLPKTRETVLILACRSSVNYTLDLFKYLIEKGADVNATCANLQTPLIYATLRKNTEVYRLFLNAGARINAVDKYRVSALGYSVFFHCEKSAKFLLENGAEIDGQLIDCIKNASINGDINGLHQIPYKGYQITVNESMKRIIFEELARRGGKIALLILCARSFVEDHLFGRLPLELLKKIFFEAQIPRVQEKQLLPVEQHKDLLTLKEGMDQVDLDLQCLKKRKTE